jgi:hypothetical protein
MNLTGKILTIVFVLLLLADILFGLAAFATGHQIPMETTLSILATAGILVVLIFLTRTYLRESGT